GIAGSVPGISGATGLLRPSGAIRTRTIRARPIRSGTVRTWLSGTGLTPRSGSARAGRRHGPAATTRRILQGLLLEEASHQDSQEEQGYQVEIQRHQRIGVSLHERVGKVRRELRQLLG